MNAIRYRLSSQLKFNIKCHLDRLFVNNGLYINVASGDFDTNGDRADILHRVNNKLYESAFDNWVYENDASGIAPKNTIIASGVYVNGVFNPKSGGTYKPHIDYRNGRVFFDTSVPSTATVSAIFSYKHALIDFPDNRRVNWIFSKLKDAVDYTANIFPSGFDRQLPAVVIDIQRRLSRPYSLGGAKTHDTLVVLHVISNNTIELDQINDILTERSFRSPIKGVDFNKIPQLFTNIGDKAATYKDYTHLQGDIAFRMPTIFVDRTELMRIDEIRGVWISRIHWNCIVNAEAL